MAIYHFFEQYYHSSGKIIGQMKPNEHYVLIFGANIINYPI